MVRDQTIDSINPDVNQSDDDLQDPENIFIEVDDFILASKRVKPSA